MNDPGDSAQAAYREHLQLLQHEVEVQCRRTPKILPGCKEAVAAGQFSPLIADCLQAWYGQLKDTYVAVANQIREKRDAIDQRLVAQFDNQDSYTRFKHQHHNEAIDKLVRNADSGTRLLAQDGELIRRYEPIYNPQVSGNFPDYRTHFYAAQKQFFGIKVDTFTFNLLAIWAMTAGLYVCLHFEVFRKMLGWVERRRKKN
jgi:hypothetical protein